jgi:protoporphyrinogen oxidase
MSIPELLISLPRMFGAKMDGKTVESHYSRIVGKDNFRRAVAPMFNAVICQKANDFPADMLFKKRARRKEVIKKFSLQNGIQTVIDTIAANPAIESVTSREVKKVVFNKDGFKVTLSDNSTLEAPRLALATPSATSATLVQKSFPAIAKKLAALKAERVETVGVIIKKEETGIGPIAALAAADDVFYSFVSRDTFPDPVYRGFAFHFKAGKGSREARLARIAQVLGTGNFEQVVTAEHVIPSLRLGHGQTVQELDSLLADTQLMLTGNYFTGLAIEDCVSRSLAESRRIIL